MCVDPGPGSGREEWVVDHPRLREFIAAIDAIRHSGAEPGAIIAAIRPHFDALLADETWLPVRPYQEPAPESGMGSGIGTWLLYRAADASLALSSLVVPPGATTPVHNHLAWGLVGLYRGAQDEVVYTRLDDGRRPGYAELAVLERRTLARGDCYELLPATDIHAVTTTSDVTSVSLHLLGIDNGCIWRSRFVPETREEHPFRSGYVNAPCPDGEAPAPEVAR